ncbi:MAG: hypothetical protein CL947_03040 [Epsilonproteobacteria bacterium]|nr:hypothetical protein [Campylobacterota bacterium]|tara:strand:- start:7302 stop:7631 length:330 start_codon:yes stop_codon:yes gene_type:complete
MKQLLLIVALLSPVIITNAASDHVDQKTQPQLELYVYPGCPFCKKVIQHLEENNIKQFVKIINANEAINYRRLQVLSKSTQCPFLHDKKNNIKMLESNDIKNYLTKELV